MKITLFVVLLSAIQFFTNNLYSQNTLFSLAKENTTIENILGTIEDQSEYYFLYNGKLVDVAQKVSLKVENQNLENTLNALFRNTNISYKIFDRQVVLSPAEDVVSNQQQKSISGKVTDSSEAGLSGVSVVVKGTTTGDITDMDGNYTLSNIPENATLQFSFVGMNKQEIAVGNKITINVMLTDEIIGIEEVVAVGYGVQKKATVTGSVASLQSDKLTAAPIANIGASLAGRLPGLISQQSSGLPGYDAATLRIRGFGTAIYIVDGIEADFNSIDANQIEAITILKDGAAAIYGARAGNGVVLITTKRGKEGKPTITLNTSYTMQGNTIMPKTSNSGQYAEMSRETWLNQGKPEATAPFTAEQVQKYYDGNDPQYPNTNWYKELIRDDAPLKQHNLSIAGGSERIKYYGFIGYTDQQTIWKNNGGNYTRYNLQSNIDTKILDNLTLQLDIAASDETRSFPYRMLQNTNSVKAFEDFWNCKPIYPAHLPDPSKNSYAGGSSTANFSTNGAISGFSNIEAQKLKGSIALNYTFKAIKGLSVKGFFNYLQDYSFSKTIGKPQVTYNYDIASDTYTIASSLNPKATLSVGDLRGRTLTSQFSFNYDNTIKNDHHLNILALYEAIGYRTDLVYGGRSNFLTPAIEELFMGDVSTSSIDGMATEMGRKSYVGRLNYSFKNKYLLESILRADASAKFPSYARWGYFPSISLGWRVSEENFMKKISFLESLKLRASYGESGLDNVGNFAYLSGYRLGAPTIFGGIQVQGMASTGLANPDLTWEKVAISNVGIDFSLWRRKLYGEGDVFYRERTGIPSTLITSLPSTFGSYLPPVNINSLNDRGFEFKLGSYGKLGSFDYDISGNISWSRSKWDHFEEPTYTDPDQKSVYEMSGRWTDRTFGYVSEGLFTSQNEIDELEFDLDQKENKTLRPGDIRYKDTNNDGKLDWKDQVEIGRGTFPHWMLGFDINIKYKMFDLSALFQGAFGYDKYINIGRMSSFLTNAETYKLRWTSANNNPDALVPRLGGAASNGLFSDYFFKNAGYLRLKSINIGFNMPKHWLQKTKISGFRFYIAGTNLLTFDKLREYQIDPESPSGEFGYYYPQQKTKSLGINITF